ncbi:uncharacterized protein LOC143364009 [Halictus rubicundus]|uniref:uncharacterized protein LOC143364009 n=1 Tax=Halictus rubicundus TaxID=77578 RepID=UPI00403531DC
MAFADDLVLIGENREMAEKQMQMLVKYLGAMGMELSVGTDGEVNKSSVEAYAEIGITHDIPTTPIHLWYDNESSAQSILEKINRLVRGEVKKMLNISEKTNTPFMYEPKRLGGLGLVNIENMVKIAVLKNAEKARSSSDPIRGLAIQYEKMEPRLRNYAKTLEVSWPTTIEELDLCKDRVKNEFRKQWAQLKVQSQGASEYLHKERTLKPDLVIKMNEDVAYVIDITDRFERGGYLNRAAEEKKVKYLTLLPQVVRQLGVMRASVLSIAVGSRGAIPTVTLMELKKLDINRNERITMSMIALRSSIEIANEFIDYGRDIGI